MSKEMKVNLGCGRMPLDGYWNVDLRPGPGVDQSFDVTDIPWPIPTASCDEVRADALLEHLLAWERLMSEFARVLRPGGTLHIVVPYKLVGAMVPWHVRFFWPTTFDPFCDNARMRTAVPFVMKPFVSGTLEWDSKPTFSKVSQRYTHRYPFVWHLSQRIGPRVLYWPLGLRWNMEVVLRRNERVVRRG